MRDPRKGKGPHRAGRAIADRGGSSERNRGQEAENTFALFDHDRALGTAQTNGMVERFNGRIEDVLQSHRFNSGEDL